MSDLPARLEAATEGSRELDLEVLNARGAGGWYWLYRDLETITCDRYGPDDAVGNPICGLERFTTSETDALTLVDMTGHPLWTMTTKTWSYGQHGMAYDVEITIPSREFRGRSSASLPLAICAAALRARAG